MSFRTQSSYAGLGINGTSLVGSAVTSQKTSLPAAAVNRTLSRGSSFGTGSEGSRSTPKTPVIRGERGLFDISNTTGDRDANQRLRRNAQPPNLVRQKSSGFTVFDESQDSQESQHSQPSQHGVYAAPAVEVPPVMAPDRTQAAVRSTLSAMRDDDLPDVQDFAGGCTSDSQFNSLMESPEECAEILLLQVARHRAAAASFEGHQSDCQSMDDEDERRTALPDSPLFDSSSLLVNSMEESTDHSFNLLNLDLTTPLPPEPFMDIDFEDALRARDSG